MFSSIERRFVFQFLLLLPPRHDTMFRGLLNSMNDGHWISDKASEADFRTWNVLRVTKWVSDDVGLPQYAKNFLKAKVDGRALDRVDSTVLKKTIKISTSTHRLQILEALEQLQRSLETPIPAEEEEEDNSGAMKVQYILMKKSSSNAGSPSRKRSSSFVFFESCLELDSLREIFRKHLQQQMCVENLELWEAIEHYKSDPSLFGAVQIVNEFVVPDAPRQVNLSRETIEPMMRTLQTLLSAHKLTLKSSKEDFRFVPTPPTIFQELQSTTNFLMMTHSFPIFLKSPEFKQWSDDNGYVVYMRQGEELIEITNSSDSSPRTPQ